MQKLTRLLTLNWLRSANGHDRPAIGAGGFTMIELIVSVSIMILLVGGGIASFITFNDKQQLQNSTKMIQTYLRTAQTKARVGDRPEGCDKLVGYEVRVPNGTTQLHLVAVCEGLQTEIEVQSTVLENVETIQVEGGGDLGVLFKVLHGGTENEGTITVTSNAGASETFNVSAGGEISELGYENATTTPSSSTAASPTSSPTSQTASPSPSPSASSQTNPSPSPSSPSFSVYLNQASGLSCSQLCVQQGFQRCSAVGHDTAASNGRQMTKTLGVCAGANATCTTVMAVKNISCAKLGTTANAAWTYCKCSN